MNLSQKLHRLAQERDLQIKQIATKAGLAYGAVQGYFQAEKPKTPSAPKALSLARGLDVGLQWLIDDGKDWPPPRFHEEPPYDITPWPPTGISWPEIQLMINYCVRLRSGALEREIRQVLEERGFSREIIESVAPLQPEVTQRERIKEALTERGCPPDLIESLLRFYDEREGSV